MSGPSKEALGLPLSLSSTLTSIMTVCSSVHPLFRKHTSLKDSPSCSVSSKELYNLTHSFPKQSTHMELGHRLSAFDQSIHWIPSKKGPLRVVPWAHRLHHWVHYTTVPIWFKCESHVRDKFATPILYGIDNFKFYDIFYLYITIDNIYCVFF